KALTAVTLEVQRGGIEKDKAQLAEQVVAQGEQLLLDDILGGAWTNAAPALVGQFVSEPTHRPIELVQPEIGEPVDDQTVPPLLRRAVRAGIEQAMPDSQKHRAFEIELELAFGGQRADHLVATGLPPQSLKGERRAELACGDGGGLALLISGEHHGTVGKARPRAQQPLEGAVLRQLVDAAEGGDDGLPRSAVDAVVLDDLEILGSAGEF